MTYFHEEQQFRASWIWVLLVIIDLPLVISLALGRIGPGTLIGFLVPWLVAALFLAAKLVVDVDRDTIRVSFHFLWPTRRIPIAEIRHAHAAEYNSLVDYGGWGVRLSWNGWAFNTGGAEGVLVETIDGKRVMVGSKRPRELEAAIARAIAEHAGG